jgi:hypothetical protein
MYCAANKVPGPKGRGLNYCAGYIKNVLKAATTVAYSDVTLDKRGEISGRRPICQSLAKSILAPLDTCLDFLGPYEGEKLPVVDWWYEDNGTWIVDKIGLILSLSSEVGHRLDLQASSTSRFGPSIFSVSDKLHPAHKCLLSRDSYFTGVMVRNVLKQIIPQVGWGKWACRVIIGNKTAFVKDNTCVNGSENHHQTGNAGGDLVEVDVDGGDGGTNGGGAKVPSHIVNKSSVDTSQSVIEEHTEERKAEIRHSTLAGEHVSDNSGVPEEEIEIKPGPGKSPTVPSVVCKAASAPSGQRK